MTLSSHMFLPAIVALATMTNSISKSSPFLQRTHKVAVQEITLANLASSVNGGLGHLDKYEKYVS